MKYTIFDQTSGLQNVLCSDRIDGLYVSCKNIDLTQLSVNRTHGADGLQSYFVRAVDRATNVSDTHKQYWNVDQTPPSVDFIGNIRTELISNSVNLNFIGTDNLTPQGELTYVCKFGNQANPTVCIPPYVKNGLTANVDYPLEVQSVDRAGNLSPVKSLTVKYVPGPASVEITQVLPAAPRALNRQQTSFLFQGTDGGMPIVNFICFLSSNGSDNGTNGLTGAAGYSACSSGVAATTNLSGNYRFFVKGKRLFINGYTASDSYAYAIDRSINDIRFINPPSDPSNINSQILFQIGGLDADAGLECALGQGNNNFTPCESRNGNGFTLSGPLADLRHYIRVRARDVAGNISNIITHQWQIDTKKPILTLSGPNVTPLVTGVNLRFDYSIMDPALSSGIESSTCLINGTVACPQFSTNGTFFRYNFPTAGNYTITIVAKDKAQNQGSVSKVFIIEDPVPTIGNLVPAIVADGFSGSGNNIKAFEGMMIGLKPVVVIPTGNSISSLQCRLKNVTDNMLLYNWQNCQNNARLAYDTLAVAKYSFAIRVVGVNLTQTRTQLFEIESQVLPPCEMVQNTDACLVLSDNFERNDIISNVADFHWSKVFDDNGSAIDVVIADDNFVANNRAAHFLGRAGNSVHSIKLTIKKL